MPEPYKKATGHEAKLAYLGEVLTENRSAVVVDACVVPATGTGDRDAAPGHWPPSPPSPPLHEALGEIHRA